MKNSLRPPRLPVNFSPCTLTSRLNADNSLVVEFTFPPNCPDAEQFAAGIVDAAAVLANLFGQFSRQIERSARTQRAEAVNDHWRDRQREVQQAYFDLRRVGMLHRAAIRSLLVDPRFDDLRHKYRWDSATFNATVKSFLGPTLLRSVKAERAD